jgi:hypothetical protein
MVAAFPARPRIYDCASTGNDVYHAGKPLERIWFWRADIAAGSNRAPATESGTPVSCDAMLAGG